MEKGCKSPSCKSHPNSHLKTPPKNVFIFTFIHLFTSLISTYTISLHYSRSKPKDYPSHYYNFHISIYSALWVLCMINLILSRVRSFGKGIEWPSGEEFCQKCDIARPKRTHHCSSCNSCVLRMDHHCVWVSNCIGLGNHKNFFWYTFYTAIGGSYHSYLMILYLFSGYESVYSTVFIKLLYFYHSLVVFVFSYFCWTLLNMQWKFIRNNTTNIEYIKEFSNNFGFIKCVVYDIVIKN